MSKFLLYEPYSEIPIAQLHTVDVEIMLGCQNYIKQPKLFLPEKLDYFTLIYMAFFPFSCKC